MQFPSIIVAHKVKTLCCRFITKYRKDLKMIETINRAEFIDMLANDHNLSKTEAKEMYEKFISTHKRALLSGKRVLVGDLYRW